MLRCIDADALKEKLVSALMEIDETPTLDVQPETQWISVEDALPPLYKDVLVSVRDHMRKKSYVRGDYMVEATYNGNPIWYRTSYRETVTHWMPLPKPAEVEI